MDRKEWETPVLIVLTRTLPEDGVLQALTCKFFQMGGPDSVECIQPNPGEVVAPCEAFVPS
jgi:hypothetical protein